MLVDMATSGSHPSVHTAPPSPAPEGIGEMRRKCPGRPCLQPGLSLNAHCQSFPFEISGISMMA